MSTPKAASDVARSDWQQRISVRSDRHSDVSALPYLPAPTGLTATGGVCQVTLDWDLVDGAVGYLLYRASFPDGPFEVVDHHGQDVLSVPHPPYVDTTGSPGMPYWYSVAAVPEVTVAGTPGVPVRAAALIHTGDVPPLGFLLDAAGPTTPLQRPWEPMIGSERLSQLLCTERTGGRPIGAELRESLRRMHDDIGVRSVRAHAIFHDDTAVYREVDGEPIHDFSVVDRIYDTVRSLGLRPVVEIGFMPRDLAADPTKTVFAYGAVISPPKDYARWGALVGALTAHLVERYGREEVVGWDFEVWNEANLEVFWSGTQQEWMHLYDVTAAAVKAVDARIPVGGPSSAAAGWVDDLLAHCRASGAPVDFVSTHTYGSPPLDVRASLRRHGFESARVLWTEWGVTPTHFNPINDSVFSAVFLLAGMRSAAGRIDALSYWVASDHFEELGRPPRLLHGGFGLQTVGNLPKPRFHAMTMLGRLGDRQLTVEATGDGAGSLVQAWASRADDGSISVLLWNLTLDQNSADGDPALHRRVQVEIAGLPSGTYEMRTTTLTNGAGDITAVADELGIADWPTDAQWDQLAAAVEMPSHVKPLIVDRAAVLEVELSMPSAVLVEVRSS